MEEILEHFKNISNIPRCSFHTEAIKPFIVNFAKKCNFEVHVDAADNILCTKGKPNLCLQAHYDMVCIGESAIELIQEGNILRAKNSTLGADNGMGMALMFWAMQHSDDLECLFSANEEVGLLGASAFTLPLMSDYLLNLDSEEEGKICIGCAGGVDVIAERFLEKKPLASTMLIYEIKAVDFLGGHSGVDIDKQIPSAIKALACELGRHELELICFEGGDRRNAIAKDARAIVASSSLPKLVDTRLVCTPLQEEFSFSMKESTWIIYLLNAFAQGIRNWDKALNMPSVSINIGCVSIKDDRLLIECAARAMDDENLAILADETESFFKLAGCHTRQEHWHGAWKPNTGAFTHRVRAIMQTIYPDVSLYAIHAGLECGELISHQQKPIEALSIGPTIRFPHSLREECDLDSIGRIKRVLDRIIQEVNHGIN